MPDFRCPDWPTSFGSIYKIPHMVGGVRFEHTHRMIAEFVGLLTIILAIWTWRVEKRRWMKALAVGALGTVVAQGVLGGLTVLFYLPPAISSAHAALAQTFFCIAVVIALFTGRRWVEEVPEVELDSRRPSLITLAFVDFCVLRAAHHGSDVSPSRNELVAARSECAGSGIVLTWTAVRAWQCTRRLKPYGGRRSAAGVADHAALPGIRGLSDASSVGPRRGATRITHGDVDGGPRRGGRATARNRGGLGDSGLAACASGIRRARARRRRQSGSGVSTLRKTVR